jgi:hypothetical protein
MYALSRQTQMAQYFTYDSRVFDTGDDSTLTAALWTGEHVDSEDSAHYTRLVGKLPILDTLFATPANHRVHHGIDPQYIDRNYGEFLMIWDYVFGTYQPEAQAPTYGVVEPIETCLRYPHAMLALFKSSNALRGTRNHRKVKV